MKNISFSLTTPQFMDRTKTVTRRLGWWTLQPGERLHAVEKCMGLKKGEKMKRIGMIEIVSSRAEPLNAITKDDCIREGFPDMEPHQFVEFFAAHNKCKPHTPVNRIEFKPIDEPAFSEGGKL